jgi:hypothetical protein
MDKLIDKNPTVEINTETEHINISKLWNDDTFMCRFPKSVDLKFLNELTFPEEFSAIIHNDSNEIEFIFAPLKSDDNIIGRKFDFNYKSKTFEISYEKSTDRLKTISKSFRETEESDESRYRNLRPFRDFLREDKSPSMKRFFQGRELISFFVKGDLSVIKDSFDFAKCLNFYMSFYDRKSPSIYIHKEKLESESYSEFCHSVNNEFPSHINSVKVEPVLLDLFHIASETKNTRLKYIFYYQVLEYCSYYYLNEGLKRKLNNIVKNPDIINNSNYYSQLLIEEFKDHFKANNDKQKLEKLITENCNYHDIRNDIIINTEYFSKDLKFDGGFKIPALFNDASQAKNPPKDIMKSIIDRVDKIRNVLVHIRESRENKVILPTPKNNNMLIPYLFLLRRLSEIVAIKND